MGKYEAIGLNAIMADMENHERKEIMDIIAHTFCPECGTCIEFNPCHCTNDE